MATYPPLPPHKKLTVEELLGEIRRRKSDNIGGAFPLDKFTLMVLALNSGTHRITLVKVPRA